MEGEKEYAQPEGNLLTSDCSYQVAETEEVVSKDFDNGRMEEVGKGEEKKRGRRVSRSMSPGSISKRAPIKKQKQPTEMEKMMELMMNMGAGLKGLEANLGARMDSQAASQKEDINGITAKMDSQAARMDSQAASQKEDINGITAKMDSQAAKMDSQAEEMKNLGARINSQKEERKEELRELKEELEKSIGREISSLAGEVKVQEQRIIAIEITVTEQVNEMEVQKKEIGKIKEQGSVFRDEMKKSGKKLEDKVEEVKLKVEEVADNCQGIDLKIELVQGELKVHEEEVKQWKNQTEIIVGRSLNASGDTYDYVVLTVAEDPPVGSPCSESLLEAQGQVTPGSVPLIFNWSLESTNGREKNVTFRIRYRSHRDAKVREMRMDIPVLKECRIILRPVYGNVTSMDIPRHSADCQLAFSPSEGGLLVEITRLNVPCQDGGGFIKFSDSSRKLCGKLEELPVWNRRLYFTSPSRLTVQLHGRPVFAFKYRFVHSCYNVTLTARNDSLHVTSKPGLQCAFHVHLPYGNKIVLRLMIGDANDPISNISSNTEYLVPPPRVSIYSNKVPSDRPSDEVNTKCDGLLAQLWDGMSNWSWCTKKGDAVRDVTMESRGNLATLKVTAPNTAIPTMSLRLEYQAKPVDEIVQQCPYGWVAMRQFCISAVEDLKLGWNSAETDCVKRGGHLAGIVNDQDQTVVDNVLLHSPGFKEQSTYWIGASDKTREGDYRWVDGQQFSYTNWFPGWPQERYYNRQPNDDGYSEQDCVEVRREFRLQSGMSKLANSFMWNDRDCNTPNMFLCEILQLGAEPDKGKILECNRSVTLSREQPRAMIVSPGFPRPYPDNAECFVEIFAPSGYRLILDFEELVLEDEPYCSYDYIEILEDLPLDSNTRKLCGDWSAKLKLLRYVSKSTRLIIRFVSDYSHHYSGFKARVSMENAVMECADDRLQMFNNSCYLFVSYPEVSWETALQICKGMKAELASIQSAEEEFFVTTNIRDTPEYSTSALYWLGGKLQDDQWQWIDGSEMLYTSWSDHNFLSGYERNTVSSESCLGIQWTASSNTQQSSGLHWKPELCSSAGGYVCKRANQGTSLNYNRTLNGSEGYISSPNFPGPYYNNLDYIVHLTGPERTRLVVKFTKLDLEPQNDCLYDFVELRSGLGDRYVKWCNSRHSDSERFHFVSENNEVLLRFHSDYSVSGTGFSAFWRAVDVSGCPFQTLTAREGYFMSPNFPHFLLNSLDCATTILAPAKRRVWLEFSHFDIGHFELHRDYVDNEAMVNIDLETTSIFHPFRKRNLLSDGVFLSYSQRLTVWLKTGSNPSGVGFEARYKTVNTVKEERVIDMTNVTMGTLMHLNYPDAPPPHVEYTQHLVAPPGYVILLEIFHASITTSGGCPNGEGLIEVRDNYAENNGSLWHLCDDQSNGAPVAISSYFNTLHLTQKSEDVGVNLNGTVRILADVNHKLKLLRGSDDDISVESCFPNPCMNGGKCINTLSKKFCQCNGHFTGMFCALTYCDADPCIFGECKLSESGYTCVCQKGYTGNNCDHKQRPCASNPCESRGECTEKGDSFHCQCHAWWEGPRCERKMMNIPYKPLSERMLQEPFWLGLITVTVVLGFIGLIWCAKRHFPEKLEKLLQEEAERNRPHLSSHLRPPSVREQIAAASAAMVVVPSPQTNTSRSIFGRLGIRKPSLLSLTSSHGHSNATAARTFSLDDLLKPPPRRTPSPRKKRTNSTPTKKNIAEKKQILQHLITPSASQQCSRNINLGELIQLSERKQSNKESDIELTETTFNVQPADKSTSMSPIDAKLEKKVTFARLLSKVSQEMSSGSEAELTGTSSKLPQLSRANSSPPSPAAGLRSPHSTSSNQGSDSMSSLDVTGTMTGIPGLAELLSNRRTNRMAHGGKPVKNPSADSILAMFRNFTSNSVSNSQKASPSTTPTASSPQDDVAGSDESSTSSAPTPLSSSSYTLDSPPALHKNTIEIPVLDVLAGGNSGNLLHPPTILLEVPSSSIGKCLSPIRELPTPLPTPVPSPALTPVMPRSNPYPRGQDIQSISFENKAIQLPCIMITNSDDDDDSSATKCNSDIEDEPKKSPRCLPPLFLKTDTDSGPETRESSGENSSGENGVPDATSKTPIIPVLTIQQPSPTRPSPPVLLLPGSPPLRRASVATVEATENPFSLPVKQRKLLKEIDKPNSLDLACPPPMITVTCNASEAESDTESVSPANKPPNLHPPNTSNASGMCYLSPFSMCSRADRTASDTNLSSSGYSSMASPGPSRCGSNSPLCPSEAEDNSRDPSPGPGRTISHCHEVPQVNIPTTMCTPKISSSTEVDRESRGSSNNDEVRGGKGCSDSETLSDDLFVESNDEGIGTDQLDEKIEDGELKSAKELEMFIGKELLENGKVLLGLPSVGSTSCTKSTIKGGNIDAGLDSYKLIPPAPSIGKSSLQLPSIIVQSEMGVGEKYLSPVSSRSESPLSDKMAGPGRFSPLFYGRNKDQLPFTDSDGLYDCPSSDYPRITSTAPTQQHRKSTGRRRERRLSNRSVSCNVGGGGSKTPSPTKCLSFLDVPGKDSVSLHRPSLTRKPSPKRSRLRPQQPVSSSSSSESINSGRELGIRLTADNESNVDNIGWSPQDTPSVIEKDWKGNDGPLINVTGEDTYEDMSNQMLSKTYWKDDVPIPHRKVSRLRTIGNQIRFLRRLELSLKRRERLVSPSDSYGDDDDDDDGSESPPAMSPLLQKSHSACHLHQRSRGRLKPKRAQGGELLLPQEDTWKGVKVTSTSSGHTD